MFEVGSLVYFTQFFFKNGNTPKPKYFVVLGVVDTEVVLASLPTSQDHVPAKYGDISGCINDDLQQFNVFKFKANLPVTDDEFCFPKDTFIYGEQLDTYPIDLLLEWKKQKNTDIELKGQLKAEYLDALRDCLKKSAKVKRRYKRYL